MSARRVTPVAALLLALAVAAGCGGDDAEGGGKPIALEWKQRPLLIVPATLPNDRIVRGEVENASLDDVEIEAKDLRLLDAGGRRIASSPTFIEGYVHSLYPYNRGPGSGPGRFPEEERRRLGQIKKLKPGQSSPLTISWHDPPGSRRAVRIDYGDGFLDVSRARRVSERDR